MRTSKDGQEEGRFVRYKKDSKGLKDKSKNFKFLNFTSPRFPSNDVENEEERRGEEDPEEEEKDPVEEEEDNDGESFHSFNPLSLKTNPPTFVPNSSLGTPSNFLPSKLTNKPPTPPSFLFLLFSCRERGRGGGGAEGEEELGEGRGEEERREEDGEALKPNGLRVGVELGVEEAEVEED